MEATTEIQRISNNFNNVNTWLVIAVKHNLSSCKIKASKKKQSDLNGIRTYDLCDTGAVHYQLSYQAIWELVTLWVLNIPADGEEYI